MSNREFTAQRTMLANAMATAGAELLEYMGVSSALAAIPNTEPPQYVVAGTLAMIGKLLPTASVPSLTAPAPLTDYVLMPKRLTAENGAKGALSGEFKESVTVTCHECGGSGDDAESDNDAECPECKGDGTLDQAVPVTWDTIKDIYARAVELLAKAAPAAPVQTAEEMVRFCPHCASIGEIGAEYRDCCPDGSAARHIPRKLAEVCRDTFKLAIGAVAAPVQAEQAQAEPVALKLTAEDLGKVQNAKRIMVDALISSNLRYGACGVISYHLERLLDHLANPAPVAALPAQAEQAEPVIECDGWKVDGSLIYRLNDKGVNCDEINITMVNGSRADSLRHDAAVELLYELTSTTPAQAAAVRAAEVEEWSFSTDEEHYRDPEPSRAAIIQHALAEVEAGEEGAPGFWIGRNVRFVGRIDAGWIIEQLQEQAHDECGEWAETYLENVTKEEEAELESLVNAWAARADRSNFWTVKDVEYWTVEKAREFLAAPSTATSNDTGALGEKE